MMSLRNPRDSPRTLKTYIYTGAMHMPRRSWNIYIWIYIWLCDASDPSVSGESQKRYAEDLCRPGMPNRYAEHLDTETTFGKDSAPDGYAEKGMPNTYAEQVCRTGMPKTYAEKVCRTVLGSLPTLKVSRPYLYMHNLLV